MADQDTKPIYDEVARDPGKPVFSVTVADFHNALGECPSPTSSPRKPGGGDAVP